jgi:Mg2+-importing ATPase
VPLGRVVYRTRVGRWISWMLGAALVATVVAAALHASEAGAFLRLAQRTTPSWLLAAVVLQAATYVAQGQVWRLVAAATRFTLPWTTAYALSLAKLFVDQALPSGGISGTVVIARALEARGMARPAVMATVVVNTASHYAAYVASLAAALAVAVAHRQANPLIVWAAIAFTIFGVVVTVTVLALAGAHTPGLARRLVGCGPMTRALGFLEDADPRLARRPRLVLAATACQLAIVALDAATVWVLIRALGAAASPGGVFTSFMISSLLRTVGVLPGGLGTFEATSVVTLHMVGVDLPVALSATLLFRGLSFWLPMPLGLWCSRRVVRPPRAAEARPFDWNAEL